LSNRIALLATVFTPLPWWVELLMRLGLILAVAAIARGLSGIVVQRPLPAALPLALVAVASLG
jgi:hypothetical protein